MTLEEDTKRSLSELKRKRETIKADLTRVHTFLNNFDPTVQAVSLLEFRQEELPQINRKFDEIQCQIELITIDDLDGSKAECDIFERDYFAIRSQIQEIINHEKASYMTTQCLVKLAEEFSERYPKATTVIKQDFYMDDLMTGCDTEAECCRLQQGVSMILNSAKLPLCKWCSNSQTVLQCITKEEQDPLFTLNISEDDTVKSLGLCWKLIADEFHFQITDVPENYKLLKEPCCHN